MEDNERIFPDDKLVSMFRNGDSHAFEILLSRYDECIMRAIRKCTAPQKLDTKLLGCFL